MPYIEQFCATPVDKLGGKDALEVSYNLFMCRFLLGERFSRVCCQWLLEALVLTMCCPGMDGLLHPRQRWPQGQGTSRG